MTATLSRWTIGVMGSGSHEHDDLAAPLGRLLAGLGVNLLTGGGGGVMRAVSRAFVAHRTGAGICIGVLPCASESDRATTRPGYPNEFVELAIRTHLPRSGGDGTGDLSRNHINVLSAAAIVALPGQQGTASEVSLALRYGTPVIVFSTPAEPLTHFPAARRTSSLDEVEAFLMRRLEEMRTPG